MSFYNTIGAHGAELERYEGMAKRQEDAVYTYFRDHPPHEFTPEEIGRWVLPNAPRTSWGRALTNLTTAGLLEKTERQARGKWRKPIYFWRLKVGAPTPVTAGPSLPLFP